MIIAVFSKHSSLSIFPTFLSLCKYLCACVCFRGQMKTLHFIIPNNTEYLVHDNTLFFDLMDIRYFVHGGKISLFRLHSIHFRCPFVMTYI